MDNNQPAPLKGLQRGDKIKIKQDNTTVTGTVRWSEPDRFAVDIDRKPKCAYFATSEWLSAFKKSYGTEAANISKLVDNFEIELL